MPYGCVIYFVVGTGVLDCPLVTDYGMLDILCHLCGIIANFLNGSHRCLVNEDGKFARLLASLVRAPRDRRSRQNKNSTLLGVLITVCSICLPRVANKRIFLMPYGITLLCKDEKFALCKPSVCAGSRAGKTRNKKTRIPNGILAFLWSGLRGSNPPPSPWQGDALPNELNPHF